MVSGQLLMLKKLRRSLFIMAMRTLPLPLGQVPFESSIGSDNVLVIIIVAASHLRDSK